MRTGTFTSWLEREPSLRAENARAALPPAPRGRARTVSLADGSTRLSETGPSVLTPARATDGPVLSGDDAA